MGKPTRHPSPDCAPNRARLTGDYHPLALTLTVCVRASGREEWNAMGGNTAASAKFLLVHRVFSTRQQVLNLTLWHYPPHYDHNPRPPALARAEEKVDLTLHKVVNDITVRHIEVGGCCLVEEPGAIVMKTKRADGDITVCRVALLELGELGGTLDLEQLLGAVGGADDEVDVGGGVGRGCGVGPGGGGAHKTGSIREVGEGRKATRRLRLGRYWKDERWTSTKTQLTARVLVSVCDG